MSYYPLMIRASVVLSNKIFASKYTLYIPDKEELEEQAERVVKKYKKK